MYAGTGNGVKNAEIQCKKTLCGCGGSRYAFGAGLCQFYENVYGLPAQYEHAIYDCDHDLSGRVAGEGRE